MILHTQSTPFKTMAFNPLFAWTYKVVVLACLVFVVPSRQETPQYSYECQEDGTVVLHGFSPNSYIVITETTGTGNSANCANKNYPSNEVGHITIECSKQSKTFDVQVQRTFTFEAVDALIDSKVTKSSILNPQVGLSTPSMGQHIHKYRIMCKAIPKGVVDHVIGHVGVQNVAALPTVFNSVGTIEMRFKSEEATKESALELLPDISSVYLGDKFYMYLKYMGSQAYTLSPQDCTAYGGNKRAVVQDASTKAVLWSYSTCASDASRSYHLMKNFLNVTDSSVKIVYAEMYGFNFVTNGDITIECNVKVCRNPADPQCKLKMPDTCPPETNWVARKRRTPKRDHMKVYGTLKVLNRGDSNSSGIQRYNWISIIVIQLILLWTRG